MAALEARSDLAEAQGPIVARLAQVLAADAAGEVSSSQRAIARPSSGLARDPGAQSRAWFRRKKESSDIS